VHTPGLKVVVPSTAADAKGLLLSSIFDDDPCVVIEMNALYFGAKDEVPSGDYRVPLGSARLAREGTDLTLITYGRQVLDCLAVADQLVGEGISIEVLDLRSL
jgi:pyruvate dehydrogenase E1 component beta subunit